MPLPTVEHQQGPWVALQEQAGCGALVEGPSPGNALPLPVTGRELLPSFLPEEEGRDHGFSCLVLGCGSQGRSAVQEHRARHPGKQRVGRGEELEEGNCTQSKGSHQKEPSPVTGAALPSPIFSAFQRKGQALSPPSSSSALQSHEGPVSV